MHGFDEIAVLDNVFHTIGRNAGGIRAESRAIIEHAVDVICSVDADLKFLAVNPASETVLGYKPDEDELARAVGSTMVPADREKSAPPSEK